MRTSFLVTLASACLIPVLASAAPERLYCEVTKSEGAFGNQMFFEYDGDKGRVVDGIILNTSGKPIPGKVTENTAKKMTMTWSVVLTNGRGQTTKMAYRAAVLKGSNKLVLTAKPHGYSNTFSARGRCQPTRNPMPGT